MTSGFGSPEEGSVGTREAIASNSVVVRGDQEGLSEERTGRNTQVELDPETARVVERLKNIENEAEAAGRLIGSNWANETATLKELKEVATKPAGLFLGCRPVVQKVVRNAEHHGLVFANHHPEIGPLKRHRARHRRHLAFSPD